MNALAAWLLKWAWQLGVVAAVLLGVALFAAKQGYDLGVARNEAARSKLAGQLNTEQQLRRLAEGETDVLRRAIERQNGENDARVQRAEVEKQRAQIAKEQANAAAKRLLDRLADIERAQAVANAGDCAPILASPVCGVRLQ